MPFIVWPQGPQTLVLLLFLVKTSRASHEGTVTVLMGPPTGETAVYVLQVNFYVYCRHGERGGCGTWTRNILDVFVSQSSGRDLEKRKR